MNKLLYINFILILLFSADICKSQSRLDYLSDEPITSIKIFHNTDNDKTEEINVVDNDKMMSIITYIQSIEYIKYDPTVHSEYVISKNWKYKIVFEGSFDQIYYFDNYSFIGKSIYIIDERVVTKFQSALENI